MLTEIDCKNAVCPADKKRIRLNCSSDLYLEVTPETSA